MIRYWAIFFFIVASNSAFGKMDKFHIGVGTWINPKIKFDSLKVNNVSVGGNIEVDTEYKSVVGLSTEFFEKGYSCGNDIFLSSDTKYGGVSSIAGNIFFCNLSASWDSTRIFAGIGGMLLDYREPFYEVDIFDSLGWIYQIGIGGISFEKFFVDILVRGGSGSVEGTYLQGSPLYGTKTEAKYSFLNGVLRIGLVFEI